MNSASSAVTIEFNDLGAQQSRIRQQLDTAIARVLEHGSYIMGPEVTELEQALAGFCGAKHVITCASGTDALVLALMAKGLEPGDAVIVPSFTFCATAEAVCLLGGIPLFVDVDEDTFVINAANLRAGIDAARRLGLRLRGVISVDLYGQPCDYNDLEAIAREQNIFLICDAAQAFGAKHQGRSVGTFGDVTTTSFFPAKPLGCYGDGGAVFTDDDEAAAIMRSLRVHGQGRDKYDNVRVGLNARLDTLQAAILLQKLILFPEEVYLRQSIAAYYSRHLKDVVKVPVVRRDATSVWAQYTIRTAQRERMMGLLKASGVPTAVYYGRPLHQQTAYRHYPVARGMLAVTECLAKDVLSLPMHAWLRPDKQDHVMASVRSTVSAMGGYGHADLSFS